MEIAKLTPLMQQYWDVKSAHGDKVVLFRMGDFFEMFHQDAEIAAPILGIALTSRNKKAADETKMCGVPHHSVGPQINKLLAAGYKVAICDQVEDPKLAKGIVRRAVTRILSPGVVFDPETLDARAANYLGSFDEQTASFLDVSTGEAFYFRARGAARDRLLASLHPVELVLTAAQIDEGRAALPQATLTEFDEAEAKAPPKAAALGSAEATPGSAEATPGSAAAATGGMPEAVARAPLSARRLFAYARKLQGDGIARQVLDFERREAQDRLFLGSTVLRHLEVFATYRGEAKGSLFAAIDRCKSSAGSRLLRQWLQFPLASPEPIERRLAEVELWFGEPERLAELRRSLGGMGDVARRLGKLANPSCNPRDLLALAEALEAGLEASRLAPHLPWSAARLEACDSLARDIRATLVDEPPVQSKNGGLIRRGVDDQLDELVDLAENASRLILELEERERAATGIASLKIRFNSVFGYYIEITNAQKDKIPKGRYERKQTLANAERFLTKELEELERKVLSAAAQRNDLEAAIFDSLKSGALNQSGALLGLARDWAELDALSGLAQLARDRRYCRPSFSHEGRLALKQSRHPVVEQSMDMPFAANDIALEPSSCLMLTGPNMAGKSTLMRQVAAIAIMAQIGSFVPAERAELPLFDRVFTRIGASDYLTEGLSTFMVEMTEAAEMLRHAGPRSLVILDEVGRGTSTYDGMSLAQAILEHLLAQSRATTLFATHYHELTRLAERYPQLKNAHMEIHERNGEITFLHQLAAGSANKSYGIHVARLAGLPASVTRRAADILKRAEAAGGYDGPQLSLLAYDSEPFAHGAGDGLGGASAAAPEASQVALDHADARSQAAREVMDRLRELDVSSLTPLDALNRLAQWQQSLS
jgi:DNA mismatch repair protein MutS